MSKMANEKSLMNYTGSFLSYMLMPQWRTMMPAFSHLMPVMIRILALMLVQAELLRPNHPALMYGIAHKQQIKMSDLLFEAWNNMRLSAGIVSVYQWGIFLSIGMLILLLIATAFLSMVEIAKVVVPAGQAQVFDHPSGADTSFTTVPAGTPGDLFDQSFPTQANGDLAIDILNKVLRQAAGGTSGIGGILQNALGELFRIYNTAVLLVGSILVFWAILSVIIDTNRTGQIGGGDKSFVWITMRFVMAIGLLVPMNTGFNAGQYFVIKLAELGSNFGSQLWSAYVTSAVNESLIAPYTLGDPTSIVVADTRNAICMFAMDISLTALRSPATNAELYNYDIFVKTLTTRAVGVELQRPAVAPIGTAATLASVPGETYGIHRSNNLFFYGNNLSSTFCGGFIIPSPNDPRISVPFVQAGDVLASARREMRKGHWDGYINMLPWDLACGFMYQNFPDRALREGAVAGNPYGWVCNSARLTACGFSAYNASPVVQPMGCMNTLADDYATHIRNGYQTNVLPLLRDYVNLSGPTTLIGRVNGLGWAGMGLWYHEISRLNALVADFTDGGVRVIEPDFGGDVATAIAIAGPIGKAQSILSEFDGWWQNNRAAVPVATQASIDSSGTANPQLSSQAGKTKVDEDNTYKKLYSFIEGGESGEKMNVLLNIMVPGDGWSLVDIKQYESLYPLAMLQKVGEGLMVYAMAGIAVNFALSLTAACELESGFSFIITIKKYTDCGDIFLTILESPIGQFIDSIIGLFFISAMFLVFVVPLIPWIRVTFAVMAWIFTVFEATVMISLVALMHLRVSEEALFMQSMRDSYILLLNLLLRPALVVIGFVGGLLIFNAMVGYVNLTFSDAVSTISGTEELAYLQRIFYTVAYVGMIYSMANASFKLIDQTPNWVLTWMGVQRDPNFDDNMIEGMMYAGANLAKGMSSLSAGAGRARERGNAARSAPKGGDGISQG